MVIDPGTAPVKVNVPVAPVVAFLMMMVLCLTLLNVQVTTSPTPTEMAEIGEPSSHDDVVSHPATGVSATAYEPLSTSWLKVFPEATPFVVVVVMEPAPPESAVPVKPNVPVAPVVAFLTTIVPFLTFLNTQLTIDNWLRVNDTPNVPTSLTISALPSAVQTAFFAFCFKSAYWLLSSVSVTVTVFGHVPPVKAKLTRPSAPAVLPEAGLAVNDPPPVVIAGT